jgi:hypothetical protein
MTVIQSASGDHTPGGDCMPSPFYCMSWMFESLTKKICWLNMGLTALVAGSPFASSSKCTSVGSLFSFNAECWVWSPSSGGRFSQGHLTNSWGTASDCLEKARAFCVVGACAGTHSPNWCGSESWSSVVAQNTHRRTQIEANWSFVRTCLHSLYHTLAIHPPQRWN